MMTLTTQFLRGQLDAYSESWKRDHERAMACWELESRLKVALILYDLIVEAAEHRGEELGADFGPARESFLREFDALFRDWLKSAREVQSVLAGLESEGYQVAGSARINEAINEVIRMARFPVDGLIRSLRSMAQGKGRPIAEIRNELRNRDRE